MGTSGCRDCVWGFWKSPRYALPRVLLLCGLICMCIICWCWDPEMVMVVGILTLTVVSMVANIAYA